MNVLVIPEDFRKDQYILKPVIEAMFAALGRPRAKVLILRDPVLGGIAQALNWETLAEVIDRYRGMVDVFLLIVDRDGDANRRAALDRLEQLASTVTFLGEHAWQEIEVWAIAAQPNLPAPWAKMRAERDPKELYFAPLAKRRNLLDEPGQGRRTLGVEAGRNYERVRKLCPEDVGALEARSRHVSPEKAKRRTEVRRSLRSKRVSAFYFAAVRLEAAERRAL